MKHLTNIHNPYLPTAYAEFATLDNKLFGTKQERWNKHLEWVHGLVVGNPIATDKYTQAELLRMGMIGIYSKES